MPVGAQKIIQWHEIRTVNNVVPKQYLITKKPQQNFFYWGFLWCHRESNQGHKDFQSFALPTELWHHFLFWTCVLFVWDCKGRHFFFTSKLFCKNFSKKCIFFIFHWFFTVERLRFGHIATGSLAPNTLRLNTLPTPRAPLWRHAV